ncbi:glycosyltransferase family 39 protein [Terrarubrum flagellatum]|uniref:glycosyltransferase family 39 protein n=1 Tax=Terrirubrum flagellatum TaxID=2895980 RepID=UPI00314519AE
MANAAIPAAEHSGVARLTAGVGFWLGLHVIAWTIYATLSNGPADIHHDMAEAYAWGREFQLGYFKHPPFWAWVAGLWFAVMPRADWAFYLLSMINAAVGLAGVWLIAGRLISDRATRLAAVLLLEFVPFYHFLGFKFNANTILISLWPWAIYFFLRTIEEKSWRVAIGLGLVAGLGLLSKYYFAILLASFGLAALIDTRRWDILRSPAPWIAIAAMLIVIAPHVWWLTENDYAPFKYVSDTAQHARAYIAWKAVQFGFGCLLFHIVVIGFLGVFSGGSRGALLRFFSWKESSPRRRLLLVVALAPPALTMLSALVTNVKIDTSFAIGIFPVIPLLLLTTPGYRMAERAPDYLRAGVIGLMAVMLIASPVIGYVRFARHADRSDEPRLEAAREAEAIFLREFNRPLRIVAGSWPYADETPFYARGPVSQFIDFSFARAPWITPERLAREGAAAICIADDAGCRASAQAALTGPLREAAMTVRKRSLGREGREVRLTLLMQAPR